MVVQPYNKPRDYKMLVLIQSARIDSLMLNRKLGSIRFDLRGRSKPLRKKALRPLMLRLILRLVLSIRYSRRAMRFAVYSRV